MYTVRSVAFKKSNRFSLLSEVDELLANGVVLLATLADDPTQTVVGCAALVVLSDPTIVDMGYAVPRRLLVDVNSGWGARRPYCIDQSRKGTGLGAAFLRALKSYARDTLGCTTMEITVINHRS